MTDGKPGLAPEAVGQEAVRDADTAGQPEPDTRVASGEGEGGAAGGAKGYVG